jgi:hypothetical protein
VRIALLSMLEPAGFGNEPLRAFLKVGGSSIARHQLALVLALGCQKIICLARNLSTELVSLQHEIERAGARFHCVTSSVSLGGLITATDEIVVVSDGLLAPPHFVDTVASGAGFVLVQPVEAGIAAGFERIDSSNATAGLMRIPGRLIERLSELPSDCDVVSALTRIALQSGVSQRQLPLNGSEGAQIKIVRDSSMAVSYETQWFRLLIASSDPASPSTWLASRCVKLIGPAVLTAGNGWLGGSNSLYMFSILALSFAHLAGWLAYVTIAVALCAVAWFVALGAGIIRRVERESLLLPPERLSPDTGMAWLVDVSFVALFAWLPLDSAPAAVWLRLFVPFMLITMFRVVPLIVIGTARTAWSASIADRGLIFLLLAIAASLGFVFSASVGLACLYALIALVWPRSAKLA